MEVKIEAPEAAELQGASDSDPYGLGIAYEVIGPEEAEAYYESMSSRRISVDGTEKGPPQDAVELQDAAKPDADAGEAVAELLDGNMELPTSVSASTTATVSVTGTTQYIQIRPSVSGTYVFESTNTSGDPVGFLYNSARSELSYNDDGGTGRNFKITYDLSANTTYYLGVRFYSASSSGNIAVRATCISASSAPETTLSQPAATSPATYSLAIPQAGQICYARFTPTTSGTYIFESTSTSGTSYTDTYGYLYAADRTTELAHNDDGGEGYNFRISYELTAGTTSR